MPSSRWTADMVLDQQEAAQELDESVRVKVREALLKRHHHQNEKKRNNLIPMVRSFAEAGRKQSEPHSMDKSGEVGPGVGGGGGKGKPGAGNL